MPIASPGSPATCRGAPPTCCRRRSSRIWLRRSRRSLRKSRSASSCAPRSAAVSSPAPTSRSSWISARPRRATRLVRAGQTVFDQLDALPFPSVAAIHGFALGGGLELALACTYRVGADDAQLSLGLPEVMLGIHPGFGGTVRSVRLLGVRPAFDLMLKGKPYRGARALEVGLIDRLVAPADLKASAKRLLLEAPPRRSPPFVEKLLNLKAMRPFIARQATAALRGKLRKEHYPAPYAMVDLWHRYGAVGAESFEAEAHSIATLMCSATSRNLVRVFLLQNRLKGLGGKPTVEFRHVHVIGAGVMGGDIAAWSAFRGMNVTLQDRTAELIQPALDRAKDFLEKRLKDPPGRGGGHGAPARGRQRRRRGARGRRDRGDFREHRREARALCGARAAHAAGRGPRDQYLEHQDRGARREAQGSFAIGGYPLLQSGRSDAAGGDRPRRGDRGARAPAGPVVHPQARQAAAAVPQRAGIRRQSNPHALPQ